MDARVKSFTPAQSVAFSAVLVRLIVLLCVSSLLSACTRREATSQSAVPVNDAVPAESLPARVVVFNSEREQLHVRQLEQSTGELVSVGRVSLPEQVHYAVADARARFLYASVSDGKARHWIYAFRIDPLSGALTEHGAPLVPPAGRIIHLSIDAAGQYLVLAHNQTSTLSSVRLNADGTLGGGVTEAAPG